MFMFGCVLFQATKINKVHNQQEECICHVHLSRQKDRVGRIGRHSHANSAGKYDLNSVANLLSIMYLTCMCWQPEEIDLPCHYIHTYPLAHMDGIIQATLEDSLPACTCLCVQCELHPVPKSSLLTVNICHSAPFLLPNVAKSDGLLQLLPTDILDGTATQIPTAGAKSYLYGRTSRWPIHLAGHKQYFMETIPTAVLLFRAYLLMLFALISSILAPQ
jgi:hypothetical protein